jgi:GT2 family glycosyltransferase
VPEPTWVQALLEAFRVHEADCVGGKILPRWGQEPPTWLRRELWSCLALLDRGPQVAVAGPSDGDFLYGANLALRKQAIDAVGPFRVDLGPRGSTLSRCEDSEILRRLARAGKRVVYAPGAVVHHKVDPDRLRMNYIRRWKFEAGRSAVRMSPPRSGRVSKWLVRECVSHGLRALWAYARRATPAGAQQEMLFWSQLGRITATLDRSWQRHPQSA